MNDNRLVYSTETGRICPECGKPVSACSCKKKKVVKALDPIVPIHLRTKIRWKIKELNTIKNSENTKGNSEKEKELFKSLFTEDVQKTGKLLNMDLSHWKL